MNTAVAQHLRTSHRGFSYTEVLVATVLIAVALVPALEALQPAIQGARVHERYVEDHYLLSAMMEQLLAEPFAELEAAALAAGDATTPTTYSDIVNTADGRPLTRQVYLSRYDGDNADADDDPFTDTDDGLLWVRVALEGSHLALESLTSLYP